MNKYKECKRVLIGKKERILYKLPQSNKLYIKYNGKMIGYKEYKNLKKKKQKGGHLYTEQDKKHRIKINGIEYLEDLDNRGNPLEDPTSLIPIEVINAILFDNKFYDVNTLYSWINARGSNKTVPHTRRSFIRTEIEDIERLYRNNMKIKKRHLRKPKNEYNFDTRDYNKRFYLQTKDNKYFKIIKNTENNRNIIILVSTIEDATIFYAKKHSLFSIAYPNKNNYRYLIYIYGDTQNNSHIIYNLQDIGSYNSELITYFYLDSDDKYFIPVKFLNSEPLVDEELKIIEL